MDAASFEYALLLACARRTIDPQTAETIERLLRAPIDWPSVTEAANRHAVTPLLYHSLSTTCPAAVPSATLDALRAHFHANALHNQFLMQALLKLVSQLEARSISVITYKGPVLAASIYGDLALRQFTDLDLLVHERDYERTQACLTSLGYQHRRALGWESQFDDPTGRVTVDVHQAISPRAFPSPLDYQGVWERRERVTLNGTAVSTLSRDDGLIVLCVQVAKDQWEGRLGLAKVCDIAQLLHVHPDIHWEWVMAQATGLGVQRSVSFALCLAHALFGTMLPMAVTQRIDATPFVGALVRSTCRRLLRAPKNDISDCVKRACFHWAVRERGWDKLAQLRMLWTKLHEWRASRPVT